MHSSTGRTRLYVQFEGSRGDRRPVCLDPRAPRNGIKVRVQVEDEALATSEVYLLFRRGYGDMVLCGSVRRDLLEEARRRLGPSAGQYVIAAVPVRKPRTAHH